MSPVDPPFTDGAPDDDQAARPFVRSLDAEVDALDADTVARLARARRRALATRRSPSPVAGSGWPRLAAGSFAVAATLALTITLFSPAPELPSSAAPTQIALEGDVTLGDLPVLSGDEDLEFYGSIDFLLWLEQQRA